MKKVIQKVLAVLSLVLCFGLFGNGNVFATNSAVIKYNIHVNNAVYTTTKTIYGDTASVMCESSGSKNYIRIDTNVNSGIRITDLECNENNKNDMKIQLRDGGFTISSTKPKINTGKSTVIYFDKYEKYAGTVRASVTVYGTEAKVECKGDKVYATTDLEEDVELGSCGEVKSTSDYTGGHQSTVYYYENVKNIAEQFTKNGVTATYDKNAPKPETPKPETPETPETPGSGEKDPDPNNNNPEVPGTGDSDPGVVNPDIQYSENEKAGDYQASILVGCSGAENGKGEGIVCIINLVVDIMTVGVGILSVIGITVVGIQYLTAGGSEEKTKKAKRRMLEIVIGVGLYVVLYVVLKWLLPKFG